MLQKKEKDKTSGKKKKLIEMEISNMSDKEFNDLNDAHLVVKKSGRTRETFDKNIEI